MKTPWTQKKGWTKSEKKPLNATDRLCVQKPGDHPNFRKNALGVRRPFSELSESSGVFSELSEFRKPFSECAIQFSAMTWAIRKRLFSEQPLERFSNLMGTSMKDLHCPCAFWSFLSRIGVVPTRQICPCLVKIALNDFDPNISAWTWWTPWTWELLFWQERGGDRMQPWEGKQWSGNWSVIATECSVKKGLLSLCTTSDKSVTLSIRLAMKIVTLLFWEKVKVFHKRAFARLTPEIRSCKWLKRCKKPVFVLPGCQRMCVNTLLCETLGLADNIRFSCQFQALNSCNRLRTTGKFHQLRADLTGWLREFLSPPDFSEISGIWWNLGECREIREKAGELSRLHWGWYVA